MDFRRKLRHLSGTIDGAANAPRSVGDLPLESPQQPAEERDVTSLAADKLAKLRADLARIIARGKSRSPDGHVPPEPRYVHTEGSGTLPFALESSVFGPLHVRQVTHEVNARVGRVVMSDALSVHGEQLAMLGLDPSLAGCDPSRALYVDTETTGLSGGTGTVAFLIGLGFFEDGRFVVEQLLLKRLGEEAGMLQRLTERLAKASLVVSFNGKSFDIPLLKTRWIMNRLPIPTLPPHFDLVHLARRIHRAVKVVQLQPTAQEPGSPWVELDEAEGLVARSSCKLQALERKLLGFHREGDVPSGEIPARFAHYLRTQDADAILSVCDHNTWDVASMAALVAVYGRVLQQLVASRQIDVQTEQQAETAHRPYDSKLVEPMLPRDLVGFAKLLEKNGRRRLARQAATLAVEGAQQGQDVHVEHAARNTRAVLAKRDHDVTNAVLDLRHIDETRDDPVARLALSKLLEHKVGDFSGAEATAFRGTGEEPARLTKRLNRLAGKRQRAETTSTPLVPLAFGEQLPLDLSAPMKTGRK